MYHSYVEKSVRSPPVTMHSRFPPVIHLLFFETTEATFDPTAADPTCVPLAAATTDLTAAEATALSGA